jgi:multimeric flavodoxin WrbA
VLNEALQGAQLEGAAIELYRVADKDIKPCQGDWSCTKTGECHIKDDMQELYQKLLEADGIIFGSPIYFYGISAQAKAIIDRTIALNGPDKSLANKVGGVIVTAGSLGLIDGLKDLYFYMVTRQIVPVNFVAVYPGGSGELKKMEKCIKAARELGQQMVQIASQGFKYPPQIRRSSFGYGTHTR